MSREQVLTKSQAWLRAAKRVVVLTGAGISTDSGIADFRGPQGIWTKDPDAEKLSNIHYYMNDAEIRKKAWRARLDTPALRAQPNAGHHALADLEQRDKLDALITQNIDGLHQLAGNSAAKVIELHGTLRHVRCMATGCSYHTPMETVAGRLRAGEDDPDCPRCGGILKSATISFGQNLVAADLARAEQAAAGCDLLLAVGSTLSVYPAANAVPLAKQAGAKVIIINRGPTEMDELADQRFDGSISELLPALIAGVN